MISIYPPILASTQPAFLATDTSYPIYFTLLSMGNIPANGTIQIRVVRLSNNRTIVDTSKYPDGIIYKSTSEEDKNITLDGSRYFVSILNNDLAEAWNPGYLYKVQLRFGTSAIYNTEDLTTFATWKLTLITIGGFSEWSTVMVIKAIDKPELSILNADATDLDIVYAERTERTLTPLFSGACELTAASKELEDTFKFDIYTGTEVEATNLLESSGWLRHNGSVDSIDTYRFKQPLTNQLQYTVAYSITTVNGYTTSATPYIFTATRTSLGMLEGIAFNVIDNTPYCRDNGCILVYLNATTSTTLFTGCFVLSRASEVDNFTQYEPIRYLIYNQLPLENHLCFTDFTIESGVRYRYALQEENSEGLRTDYIYSSEFGWHSVDFLYSFLYHNDLLLRLQYNLKLSSFKHTTLRAKLDTIGDKYPHLVLNGHAYYAEFPISGLISYHMNSNTDLNRWDNDVVGRPYPSYVNTSEMFFIPKSDGMYYQGEKVIDVSKFEDLLTYTTAGTDFSISTELTDDNIYIERRFREKVEEFLNDFDYKLYKSPTEGNMIVALMNVSLTPVESTGRMLYQFSATAYEVMENTFENLNEHGIITIGEYESLSSEDIIYSFGLVGEFYNFTKYHYTNDRDSYVEISGEARYLISTTNYQSPLGLNIYTNIKNQEEISIGGGYRYLLERVKAIWVEPYPRDSTQTKIYELLTKKTEAIANGEDYAEIDAEIARYKQLQTVLEGPSSTITKILIGTREEDGSESSAEIVVLPNKIYAVDNNITIIRLVSAVSPVLINYVCELTQVEDKSVGIVAAVESSRAWGLVSGVFTENDSYLRRYNYFYMSSPTYLVPSSFKDTIEYNYDVYRTTNLFNVIEERVRLLIEGMYGTTFTLNSNGQWEGSLSANEGIYYNFGDISSLAIEADSGTVLYIGNARDGSDAQRVQVGASDTGNIMIDLKGADGEIVKRVVKSVRLDKVCKLFFDDLDGTIRYLRFERGSFAIVDYVCLTTLLRLKRE